MELEDSQLSSAIAGGSSRAEEELYLRFQPRIRRKVEATLSGRPESEDLVSEILQATIMSLREGRFRGECAISTFVHAIAKNKIAEFLRRRRPETRELTDEIVDGRPAPDEAIARDEIGGAIREVLTRLKPKYRQVLYLYYYKGLSVGEIATTLAVPPRRISEWKEYGLKVMRTRFGSSLIRFR